MIGIRLLLIHESCGCHLAKEATPQLSTIQNTFIKGVECLLARHCTKNELNEIMSGNKLIDPQIDVNISGYCEYRISSIAFEGLIINFDGETKLKQHVLEAK